MSSKRILNYVIYNTLQTGTYGKVSIAKNLLTQEKCAIKMYYDRGNIDDLRHEHDLMSQLDHPNIVKCKGYFEQVDKNKRKQGYLIMEKGKTDLFEYLNVKIDVVEYINYIYDIIKGLEYLHSQDIVHCDIKAENIILYKRHAKIVDFGLSVKLDENEDRQEIRIVGTKGFIAPEIEFDGFCCRKSDIWSLGKLMQMIETEFLDDGFRMYPRLSRLYLQCLEWNHKLRPSATKLCQMFEERYNAFLYKIN